MVNDSKRRKTSSSSSPTKPAPVKLTKEEVYNVSFDDLFCKVSVNNFFQNAIAFEEQEESRFDRKQFKDCLSDITKLIHDVKSLKATSSNEVNLTSLRSSK